ncbi:hypothetical protein INS49_010494 [Diaporthe citri]|uniref:uncharacterized protein n=1 Tax=Diaporthe citri TaxID=83186 RepID=UPI001C80CA8A|nr:uncharacterized protein INS49_010494 [Diaporthe citri]KAG6362264.1 hypothetical protein INS49_010494 [Diaporthe citri]
MKLVVVGGTGLVATEIIRQSLRVPEITSLVALARRPVQLDADTSDASKFESLVVRDYAHYADSVKAALAGADACIWTVGITLGRSNTYDFAEVKHVCQDCTMAGLEALREANSAAPKPVKFVYLSGHGISQDFTTKPFIMGEYRTMRGQTEKMVQDFGRDHKEVEVQIVRPGMVLSYINVWRTLQASMVRASNYVTSSVANVGRAELSAALLDQW